MQSEQGSGAGTLGTRLSRHAEAMRRSRIGKRLEASQFERENVGFQYATLKVRSVLTRLQANSACRFRSHALTQFTVALIAGVGVSAGVVGNSVVGPRSVGRAITSVSDSPPTSLPPLAMPDQRDTPGVTDGLVNQQNVHQTICRKGYTTSVRPPESYTRALKRILHSRKGLPGRISDYELDHLVPLELGGAPANPGNLWMQPYEGRGSRLGPPGTGAETKDRLENFLRRQVCRGREPLASAQRAIASNWYMAWVAAGQP